MGVFLLGSSIGNWPIAVFILLILWFAYGSIRVWSIVAIMWRVSDEVGTVGRLEPR